MSRSGRFFEAFGIPCSVTFVSKPPTAAIAEADFAFQNSVARDGDELHLGFTEQACFARNVIFCRCGKYVLVYPNGHGSNTYTPTA